ncbi:hypothetical protein ACH5RR_001551 [Cinchona calisaya]|uniref:3-ketoacyl-CoA synthase n=1 Tax=Cinchona calisaya TaxID=153742 RepID=A0ABD3B3Q6_9GENT
MEDFVFKILMMLADFKYLASTSLIICLIYILCKSKRVYLLDFVCFRAPEYSRVPISSYLEHMDSLNPQTLEFQKKVIERSGIGNETYLPEGMSKLPYDKSFNSTIEEVEMVLFSITQQLFTTHKINPNSIDFLITNCSLTSPSPSLAAMIINKFGLRSNIKSYNLSGMGCSAGILSISLAKDLLKVHRYSTALVLSLESVTANLYQGKMKSMLLANCLFRMGGAGILLSNRKGCREKAKYELSHVVRTNLGSRTSAYECVMQDLDDEGYIGVSLSRTILQVAGDALRMNLETLGVLVLPYSELIQYILAIAWKKILAPAKKRGPYIPNFKKAFHHFCIHAGGRAIIDTIKDNLKLTEIDVEASKMTLYRFGNTSSSSTWYSLSYQEAKGRVKKGDRIWQLAFGSGFKCNSAIWKCISEIKMDDSNAWFDRIDEYPVKVPDLHDD